MEKDQSKQKYKQLLKGLSNIGYICRGTVMVLYLKCGNPNCRCKKDENAKHGPYNVWTRKVKGKTVTKYLSDEQAELCREFIQNSRKLDSIIKEMRNLSVRLIESEK